MIFDRHNIGFGVRCVARHALSVKFWMALLSNTFQFAYRYKTRVPQVRGPYGTDVVLNYVQKAGYTSLAEQYFLVALCKDAESIFEIGTFHGQTSYLLAKNIPAAHIYTLDLSKDTKATFDISDGEKRYIEKDTIGLRFVGTPEEKRITQLLGDSVAFDYSPYAGKMDAVFIDGCHDYHYVKSDTEKALQIVKPGGVLIWHDYVTYEPVMRYLDELSQTRDLRHIEGTSLVYCKV